MLLLSISLSFSPCFPFDLFFLDKFLSQVPMLLREQVMCGSVLPPLPHSITFHLSFAFPEGGVHRRTLLKDVFLPRLYACNTSLFTLLSCCLNPSYMELPCIKPGASEKVLFTMSSLFLPRERISRDHGMPGVS